MTTSQTDLIERIDAAILRLDGMPGKFAEQGARNLRGKRDLVVSGCYELRDVTADCVGGMGAQIAYLTRAYLIH